MWLPLLLSMGFTAIALLPELRPVPNLNDGAIHFLLIQEAAGTANRGGNVFDFWSPVLELGFPQFLYYQHLPHLVVVLLDRLAMGGVELITVFNGVRFALLVGFPITVFWSLRTLGFSRPGSALAAAIAPLFSANFNYGFEYDSYLWRGLGMYTQLWAMHLSLICLALLARYLDHGEKFLLAMGSLSVLILSHLIYAYMAAISSVFCLCWGLRPGNARTRTARFAIAWGGAALVTAYFWLPFLAGRVYLSASPYLQAWKYDSFGAAVVLGRLATGTLFDYGRLPVITSLVTLGVAVAVLTRSRQALFAAAFLVLWLVLYFGRATWGSITNLLPMHDGLLMHRFIGGVHVAALMAVAVGGGWLWDAASARSTWRAPLFVLVCLAVMLPALLERHVFYKRNDDFMARAESALAADPDARALVNRLASAPPGRAFAGLRTDWGKAMKFGDLAFSDLFTIARVAAVSPPYQSLSLNADLLWHFDFRQRSDYDVFNVRYVVAPGAEPMPGFLDVVERRGRYTLYECRPASYFAIGRSDLAFYGRQSEFLPAARRWLRSPLAAARAFPEVRLQGAVPSVRDVAAHPLADAARVLSTLVARAAPAGAVIAEAAAPQAYTAIVTLEEAATLVLKVTYHPNWRARVNGVQTATMMVMPSFVAIALPPGRHEISFVYEGDPARTWLLCGGAAILVLAAATAAYRRWFAKGPPHARPDPA